ncbi:MAG TPA: hypothetical protein VMM54_02545 [Nitrospirota bacterium]|nr:hypothetical protein [Nitrospirota bacterium]
MSPITISLIAFTCVLSGALLGNFIRNLLPGHHLSADSKDVIKQVNAMLATMAALVLGLLIASAKGTFDTMNSELRQISSNIVLLDRNLAHYGPEAREARDILRRAATTAFRRIWPEGNDTTAIEKLGKLDTGFEDLQEKLRLLTPRNDDQRLLQARSIQIGSEIASARWLVIQQASHSSIPLPFTVLLICWLTIIFLSFGLFCARNATLITVLLVGALSASSALLLILELDQPFGGFIELSSAPWLSALSYLGK